MIRFVRLRKDKNYLIITVVKEKVTVKVVISNIELKVIQIFPNEEIKLNILPAIKTDALSLLFLLEVGITRASSSFEKYGPSRRVLHWKAQGLLFLHSKVSRLRTIS